MQGHPLLDLIVEVNVPRYNFAPALLFAEPLVVQLSYQDLAAEVTEDFSQKISLKCQRLTILK